MFSGASCVAELSLILRFLRVRDVPSADFRERHHGPEWPRCTSAMACFSRVAYCAWRSKPTLLLSSFVRAEADLGSFDGNGACCGSVDRSWS